ncbi:hypothetical protein BD769DRAFT_1663971 [Suillus cothurnatus]|nr:hypothetical protein BD769DRAFT_1663971 [Suillus cothurnatus]
MPLLAEDYNLAVLLDLRMEEYATAWAHLTNDTIMQNQADRRCWAARLKEEAQTAEADHRLAAEGEAEHCQLALEEHKKNKSKYTPVRDADVPSNPVIFPLDSKKHPAQPSLQTLTPSS